MEVLIVPVHDSYAKRILFVVFCGIVVLSGISCTDEPSPLIDMFTGMDSSPPCLMAAAAVGSSDVSLRFSEKVEAASARISIDGISSKAITQADEFSLIAHGETVLPPGSKRWVSFLVEDTSGNALWARVPVWGINTHAARLLITEFTTKGTESQPDRVELRVLEGGDLAGLTLADGLEGNWKDRCILPPYSVQAGDFIVVYFQKSARDKLPEGTISFESEKLLGLSGSNGMLILTSSPAETADILDCALYASHTKSAHGFGSQEVYEQAGILVQRKAWKQTSSGKEQLDSSWAIDSTASTSTRSFCRRETLTDSDTREDWYVCVTKGASFGSINTDEEWKEN